MTTVVVFTTARSGNNNKVALDPLDGVSALLIAAVVLRRLAATASSATGVKWHPRGTPQERLGVPRFSKLDFPTHDGSKDPMNYWLNHCEMFFRG